MFTPLRFTLSKLSTDPTPLMFDVSLFDLFDFCIVVHGKGRGLQPVVGMKNATAFLWKDPASNTSIPVLYHDGYGGFTYRSEAIVTAEGVALQSYFRPDNTGS